MLEGAIGFAAVLVLVLLRVPIAFAMGFVGMVGYMYETSFRGAISMVAISAWPSSSWITLRSAPPSSK